MEEFNFRTYDVPVKISGEEYILECTAETGDVITTAAKDLKKLAKDMTEGKATIEDAISYGKEIIDRILGKGSSAKIFKGRKQRIDDVYDLCRFLMEIAAKFIKER